MSYRRVVVARHGGPEVIEVAEDELADPGPGEVQVSIRVSGVAFGDVLKRRGLGVGSPPFTPGYDLVGEVLRCGAGADRFHAGDRVAAFVLNGGNAEAANVPESLLVAVPAQVGDEDAEALVLEGVTAWQLLHRVAKVGRGDRILVHGGAGAVGTLVLQLARLAGVTAYATAAGERRALVVSLGGIPIDHRREDFVAEVLRREPAGLRAVLDPIGGEHLARSRRVLRPDGLLVAYGAAAALAGGRRALLGTIARVVAYRLALRRRAVFWSLGGRLGREDPTIKEDLARILDLCARGELTPVVGARFPLVEARRAHEVKERGGTEGKIVLVSARA